MGLSVHLDLAMKFLALALIVASASTKNLRFNLLAPPTELEYGFCDGSPEPLTFDVMSVTPFPNLVQNGATIISRSRSPSTRKCLWAAWSTSTWSSRASSPSRSPALRLRDFTLAHATTTVTSFSPPHLTSSAPPMSPRARPAPFPLDLESMVVETP